METAIETLVAIETLALAIETLAFVSWIAEIANPTIMTVYKSIIVRALSKSEEE